MAAPGSAAAWKTSHDATPSRFAQFTMENFKFEMF